MKRGEFMILKIVKRFLFICMFLGLFSVFSYASVNDIYDNESKELVAEYFRLSVINDDLIQANDILNSKMHDVLTYQYDDLFDPFYYAVLNQQFEMVKLLLDAGVDSNHKDAEGVSMLHWAIAKENNSIANLLINDGANISIQDTDGATPLHWAAVIGSRSMISFLIQNGADIHSKDNWAYTPLDWAIIKGKNDVVELLVTMDKSTKEKLVSL